MTGNGGDRPVNLAIVGMGRWGQRLVKSVQGLSPVVKFTHGTTRTLSAASPFAEAHGIALMDDLPSLLECADIDGVVLATPHSQHVAQVEAAVAAGKHVLCEKPLALSLQEGERAFAAASAAGRLLCVGQNRRFLPAIRSAAERLPEIGQVLHMAANFSWAAVSYSPDGWRTAPGESPAGGMTGLGIHMADLMIAFGLEPDRVSVLARRTTDGGLDDAVTALISAGPSIGVLTTMMGPGLIFQFEISGTRGRMVIDGENKLLLQRAGRPDEVQLFDHVDIERAEIEAFAAAIRGTASWPVTEAQALQTLALFEAICVAASAGNAAPLTAHVARSLSS